MQNEVSMMEGVRNTETFICLHADSGEIGHVSAPNRPLVRAKTATPKRAWGVALGADSLTQFTGHLQQPPFPRFSCFPPMTLCAWNHL
jgi:hypothetical protein